VSYWLFSSNAQEDGSSEANGRKWGMHEMLKDFSFGKFVDHGCDV
jgi:hypothetical protein